MNGLIEGDLQADVFLRQQGEASFTDPQERSIDVPEHCADTGKWPDGRSCGDGNRGWHLRPDQPAGIQSIGVFGE